MRGYKQGKVDLVEQYDNYYNQVKRLQKDDEYLEKIKRMTKKSVGKKHKSNLLIYLTKQKVSTNAKFLLKDQNS